MGSRAKANRDEPQCPSAQPQMDGAAIFGVVGGTAQEPRVAYVNKLQEASEDLLQLAEPAQPTEVFRIAAPCAESQCQHFKGGSCSLVERVVNHLPEVVDDLPPCSLRPTCRWWLEQGRAACLRCPQVTTTVHDPPEVLSVVAKPGPGEQ